MFCPRNVATGAELGTLRVRHVSRTDQGKFKEAYIAPVNLPSDSEWSRDLSVLPKNLPKKRPFLAGNAVMILSDRARTIGLIPTGGEPFTYNPELMRSIRIQ